MSDDQSLTNIYNKMVSNNEIQRNTSQEILVSELEELKKKLENKKGLNESAGGRVMSKFGFIKTLEKPQGIYIHGSVGIGKSMLMDLFLINWTLRERRESIFMNL